VLAFNSHIKSR